MSDFKFIDAAVEAKYKSTFGVDKKVTIPLKYSGMLSNISLEIADALVAMGDNQIALKETTVAKATPPAPAKDK
jgi:hypothetical protein